jgi:FkbM family methyltransferase
MVADLRTALGLALYRYGFQAPEIELTRSLLRPGDTFVDGGANVGLFTLVAAQCVGANGRVVCFEPASATRSALRRNVDLNAYPWVEVRAEALAESEGYQTLLTFNGDEAGLSSFSPAAAAGAISEDVRLATLDGALGTDLDGVRLVKLDLEGAEVKALRGAPRLLAHGPDLIVEVEPEHLARQDSSVEELVLLLETAGYRLYEIRPSNAGFQLVECVGQGRAVVNVFATRSPVAGRLPAEGV